MAVSFDLFGTLVAAEMPDNPAEAVAKELRERKVSVPDDFDAAYRKPHVDAPAGAEIPLPAHVNGALTSCNVAASKTTVRRAVLAAFDPTVTVRSGANGVLAAANDRGQVGLCSNCSVPTLVNRTLEKAGLEGGFDSIVTSVDCGWRKPHPGAFQAIAAALGVEADSLVHVGDDPETDGGIESLGATFCDVSENPVSALGDQLESGEWDP